MRLRAVAQKGSALRYIKEQTPLLCAVAVDSDPNALQYAEFQSEKLCIAAVRSHGKALQYVRRQTHAICLAAVKNWGMALQYVEKQDAEICTAAVHQWKEAMQFVRDSAHVMAPVESEDRTLRLPFPHELGEPLYCDERNCIEVIKAYGWGLRYVRNKTWKTCLAAILKNGMSYEFAGISDEMLQLAAVMNDPDALDRIERPSTLLCVAAVLFSFDQPKLTRFLSSREKQKRKRALRHVRDPEIRGRLKQLLENGWNYHHLVETELTLPNDRFD